MRKILNTSLFLALQELSALNSTATECAFPVVESYAVCELETLIGQEKTTPQKPQDFTSVVVSGSPPTSSRRKVFTPKNKQELVEFVQTNTDNHFSSDDLNGLDTIGETKTAYFGFYHLHISTTFPFESKFSCLDFVGDIKVRGSTGIGPCEHANGMIRLMTSDQKFMYIRHGEVPIEITDLWNFCQTAEIDICKITLPHFLIHTDKDFKTPSTDCVLTKTPFGLIRNKYIVEFDPCMNESPSPSSSSSTNNLEPILTLIYSMPFSFCLTDIVHKQVYASGYIAQEDQLLPYVQSRFNHGCRPSTYGEYDE